ncbi:zinc ribbon domain-containing protein [bacterium]|nr:zinc ribbon domain-containing protein [bacterium]
MKLFMQIRSFRNRLTMFNEDEPLGRLALAVIILLDIFILSVIFGGLSSHTEQLTSPREYMPEECRDVFIDRNWIESNKLDRLQDLILRDYQQVLYRGTGAFEPSAIARMHPVCQDFYNQVRIISENAGLKQLFISRRDLQTRQVQAGQQFSRNKSVYDTSLLENIAGQKPADLEAVKISMKELTAELEAIADKIAALDVKIEQEAVVQQLWNIIKPGNEALRERMAHDLRRFERIYTWRELVWQFIFLLPLFIVFYLWHTASINRQKPVQTLISSHLLIVSLIPILTRLIDVVLDLIPRQFFRQLFEWLKMLHIIALWHYAVIFVSIAAVLFFTHLIQRKWFNKQQLLLRRLIKGACHACGKSLPAGVNMCPFCGADQFRECGHCHEKTYAGGRFCIRCGKAIAGSGKPESP